MRKLIVSIHSTANDIVTGPASGDETDFMQWAQPGIDDSLGDFETTLDGVDTILLGRGTYQDLVRKWPKVKEWPDVSEAALRIGEKVNSVLKLVVTGEHPLDYLEWGEHEPPVQLSGADIEGRIRRLKQAEGGDIITFGSPVLVQRLTNAGLVDEYRILIHPVIVNEGRRLFENLGGRTDLRLLDVRTYPGGALAVTYAPVGA